MTTRRSTTRNSPASESRRRPPRGGEPPALAARLRADRQAIREAWAAETARRGLDRRAAPPGGEEDPDGFLEVLAECLETGRYHAAQAYAEALAARDAFRGIGALPVIGRLLVLRDTCAKHLATRRPAGRRAALLDAFEPAVNRLLAIVAMAFVQERETAVGRGREQLEALVEAGMLLAAERSLDSVLQRIVDVACRLLQARYGALGTLDAAGGLERFVTTGLSAEERARIGASPTGQGILGLVIRERRPIRLADLTRDPRAQGFPPHHPPMRSFLGVPIVSRGRIFGHLYLAEKQGIAAFSPEDERLAVTLAAQAAVAIENASLYEELSRSYRELTQSQDLLVRQEKLASLGRLAAGVAHELNNPLSAVGGFAEALQRRMAGGSPSGCPASEDCREYLGMIQAEVARSAGIVRRLLDYARQREPVFGPVDLAGVVEDAVAFVGRQASLAQRRIAVGPLPQPCTVQGDPQMLQQLFLNLLTNALDAVEGGGTIAVSARLVEAGGSADQPTGGSARHPAPVRQPTRPLLHPSTAPPLHGSTPPPLHRSTSWVEVVVTDTGSGIAPEHLPRIFDPFFTTKPEGKGTGLGLAICQSIVEQHGGTIAMQSPGRDQGAAVTVRLPMEPGG